MGSDRVRCLSDAARDRRSIIVFFDQ